MPNAELSAKPAVRGGHGVLATTMTSVFADSYRRYADNVALIDPFGDWLSYAELGSRARRLAHGLNTLGMQPGDRALIVTCNRPEAIVVDHALAAGGFVRVAVSHRLHPSEIAEIARDCQPRVAFVDAERESAMRSTVFELGLDVQLISLDPIPGANRSGYAELMDHNEEIAPLVLDPEQLASLPYTSGTTGEPKGVMLSHRSLIATMRNLMVEVPLGPEDVVLHVAPLTHLSGYVSFVAAARGATQVTMPSFEPESTLRAIGEYGVTILPAVPTILNMLLPALKSSEWSTGTLRTVLYGGSPIAPTRLAELLNVLGSVFVQGYGLTEVPFPLASLSKQAHAFDCEMEPPTRLASAGHVNPFVQLRIKSLDGTDAADGQDGEILVRADTAMSGYWNRPEATAEVFLEDGWVATGDIGRLESGYLYIVDRQKDIIISGGFNVYPGEIEKAIMALPEVDEVAVVGVPDARWGETVRAIVSVREGCSVTEQEIDEVCRQRIASYKRPRSIEFVDALPKTATGKIRRHELRQQYWAGQDRRVGG